jgi:tetratricopeptide (TPR) repeat protein
VRARRASTAGALRYSVLCCALMLLAASGSGCARRGGDRKAELGGLLEQGNLAEVTRRAQEYLDRGETDPWIHYHLGLALLRQDQDRAAEAALRAAAAGDSALAPAMAEALRGAALNDHAAGWKGRAAARMTLAYELLPSVELGELLEPVAQESYGRKEYGRALPLYRRLVALPDANEQKLQEWTFRFGYCLERLGNPEQALEVYRGYLNRWRDPGGYLRRVMWRYQAALLDQAEAALPTDASGALPLIDEALRPGWNQELLQRGRVLAGAAMEALGRPSDALAWYSQAVQAAATDNAGAQYVEKAHQRIEALRAVRTN